MSRVDMLAVKKSTLSIDDIENRIDKADVISFDFFDTLFIRPLCDPEDAFDILGETLGIDDFRSLRKQAQAEAFRKMILAEQKEITLEDIYCCFPGCAYSTKELMRAEYELELNLVYPNPEVVEIYRKAIEKRKIVVITSDMYLPQEFFSEALERHGIEKVGLYISADLNATKRDTGELFDLLAKDLDSAHESILHIGDNEHSDVKQANAKGLQAHHYCRDRRPHALKRYSLSASLAHGLINLYADKIPENSCQENGFYYGGPASVGFMKWIAEKAKEDQIDHILFLSRDGFLLNKLAEQYDYNSITKFNYFLGSRTAYTLAAINESNFASYIPYFLSGSEGLSPYELLERIGVPAPNDKVMQDLGLKDTSSIDLDNTEALQKFLYAYRWEILKVCRKNRQGLLSYLISLDIKPGQNLALVDVGWSGSTQEAFELAIAEMIDVNVHGYYFCLADTPERLRRENKFKMSALFSSATESTEVIGDIYQNRVAVESFFSAPHNTVVGLESYKGNVIGVEDAGRGGSTDTIDKIAGIIDGGEVFAEGYLKLLSGIGVELDAKDLAWTVIDFCTSKGYETSVLAEIENFDTWASTRNRNTVSLDYSQSSNVK